MPLPPSKNSVLSQNSIRGTQSGEATLCHPRHRIAYEAYNMMPFSETELNYFSIQMYLDFDFADFSFAEQRLCVLRGYPYQPEVLGEIQKTTVKG